MDLLGAAIGQGCSVGGIDSDMLISRDPCMQGTFLSLSYNLIANNKTF